MKTFAQYSELANTLVAQLKLPAEPRGLYAPIEYALASGGKRIRPVLVLASADAFCGNAQAAAPQALAIEMFHNFTLLHDDVMDKADVRRGRPTVHVKYGQNTAILSGDAMLTLASMIAAKCPSDIRGQIMQLLDKTAMQVYEGQQYDMDFENRSDVTVDEYLKMIRLKTSVLLGAACAMGAIVGDAPADAVNAMYAYGENLGLAFQLRDDWLDTFGNPDTFGKEIGGDILNEKKTWLLIKALEADSRVADILASKPADAEKIAAVTAAYRALGLDTLCMEQVEAYTAAAVDALADTGLGKEPLEFFRTLADTAITRDK